MKMDMCIIAEKLSEIFTEKLENIDENLMTFAKNCFEIGFKAGYEVRKEEEKEML